MSGLFGKTPQPLGFLLDPSLAKAPAKATETLLGAALIGELGNCRSRRDWNARLEHWEKPATGTEEITIDRAQELVSDAIRNSSWLTNEGISIEPQGSYHNNTNVRTDSDVDIRAVHPYVLVEYSENTNSAAAFKALGYNNCGYTNEYISSKLRSELESTLYLTFGKQHVDCSGGKAIKVPRVPGSRADVDVVPATIFHYIHFCQTTYNYITTKGVVVRSKTGKLIFNFPEQHHRNGIEKRRRTSGRFKKIVRIFKRLRNDLVDKNMISVNVASFLIECLVYAVENEYFLVETDDRYERTRRIALRIQSLVNNPYLAFNMTEINQIKSLFGPHQGWTLEAAQAFANTAVQHLGSHD